MTNFVDELRWRGLLHDSSQGAEEYLSKNKTSGYIGFDPTADSLHIGNLIQIFILRHFQLAGHTPIAVVGGATGMIGDPSGKDKERSLLTAQTLQHNLEGIKSQLHKLLDFDSTISNAARLVNNYDWTKDYRLIDFSRNIGKHITVNYMLSKDSVKNRIKSDQAVGMSFTEFTYQLLQGYDFLHLYRSIGCDLQMGGSDQWGNITTGIELIRRIENGKAYAITCPLITRQDGTKFGKTVEGNIWLDKKRTSPYKFFQYWLNISDQDASNFIGKFTFLNRKEIEELRLQHDRAPHQRIIQRKIAESVTKMVHSEHDLKVAQTASKILFGTSTKQDLIELSYEDFSEIFEGVPRANIPKDLLSSGISIVEALNWNSVFMSSKGLARRALNENSISVNKTKVTADHVIGFKDLLAGKIILLQRGKKSYFILEVD